MHYTLAGQRINNTEFLFATLRACSGKPDVRGCRKGMGKTYVFRKIDRPCYWNAFDAHPDPGIGNFFCIDPVYA